MFYTSLLPLISVIVILPYSFTFESNSKIAKKATVPIFEFLSEKYNVLESLIS